MNEIPFFVPTVQEQVSIVLYLRQADRRIRRYIRVKQKLIKLLEEQKQAIIHRAVTHGLNPAVRLKPSGVEWLEELPQHWEIRRAKSICLDIVDCKNRTPDFVEQGEFSVVRTTCIKNAKFDRTGGFPTDRNNYEAWTARGAPRLGDVFFTREAPAGEACLVPVNHDLCMGQRMMYFRPNPEQMSADYLLLNIYGPMLRKYIERVTNGSTVGHLRLGQVYSMPFVWCPVEEQNRIVEVVKNQCLRLDGLIANAVGEIRLIQEYRTRLFSDVVTGKLDVREATPSELPDDVEAAESPEEAEDLEEVGV